MREYPKHIAIIPDGDRRWGKLNNKTLAESYVAGMEAVQSTIKAAVRFGIPYLSFFIFSTENWKRSEKWLSVFQSLLERYLYDKCLEAIKEGVRIRFLGNRNSHGQKIAEVISNVEEISKTNKAVEVIFALDYGGRGEILRAVKELIKKGVKSEMVDEDIFESNLFLKDMPNPDFLIRTSGERRLSNFFLWQCAYTELYFTDILWPDFNEEAFKKALDDFCLRRRRFGS